MAAAIDLKNAFYNKKKGVLCSTIQESEVKKLILDPDWIGLDDAVIISPRDYAALKSKKGVSQEKYDELKALVVVKDAMIAAQIEHIKELESANATSDTQELDAVDNDEGGKKKRGRGRPKKDV